MTFPKNDIRFDSSLYVRELQSVLRDLHHQNPLIPLVNIDGVFGSETTAAVKVAQRLIGLEETGKVDLKTWTRLFDTRRNGLENVAALELLGKIVVLSDRDGVAQSVQVMLAELAVHFPNLHAPTPTGEYDPETVAALDAFAALLPPDGVCCEAEMLRLMARLYRLYAR